MLRELSIKNFAIIDQLRVEFGPGLNVFTGETGAGKSIVVDALNLALGERASTDLVRTGAPEAVVEAAFELNSHGPAAVRRILEKQGIEAAPGEDIIVRRVISAAGKSKVYVNGSLTNLNTLAGIGALLADIHGQHEHQSLLSVDRQMDMLDSFGGLLGKREAFSGLYRRLHEFRRQLGELEAGEREKAQREDLFRFQVNEIEAARLKEGEDEELAREQRVLANAEKLAGLAAAADQALYSAEGSALADMKRAIASVRDIAAIDGKLTPVLELLESGRAQIEEAAREVASYADGVEFDPRRLEEIGDRLDLIQKLKKKYGGTIPEVIAFGAKAAAELEKIHRSGEESERLRREIAAMRTEITAKAKDLTK